MSGRVSNPWLTLVAAVVIAGGIVFGVQKLGGHLPMPQGAGGMMAMDAGLTILLFGLLVQRSGGIAASTAAHLLWNWSEQLLLGFDPNPGTSSFGALFDHDLIGAAM